MVLVPVFLPLLLLELIVPMTSARLNSVQVIRYKESRKTQNGPVMCALDAAKETMSSSSLQDCSLNCGRDITCTGFNVNNSPVITWRHLYWLRRQELTCDHVTSPVPASTSRTHLWSRGVTCIGFNVMELACDHVTSPVPASTSRTHSRVMCTTISRK